MKKIFRKNQLVITALALMIAVAGYFSYMNNNIDDEAAAAASTGTGVLEEEYDISDEDSYIANEIFTDEGTGDELAIVDGEETAAADEKDAAEMAATDGTDGADVAQSGEMADGADVAQSGEMADGADVAQTDEMANGADAAAADDAAGAEVADTDGATDVENPGEAVLTSTNIANLDYAAEMKLNREQIRSKNKETLLEVVNNTALAENLKQDAVNKMIAMTDIAEREAAAEMLLEAKGFTDVVVSITDDNCDVVLNMGEVTDSKRAQVEDIVKRKTKISAEKIVITPIVLEDTKTE